MPCATTPESIRNKLKGDPLLDKKKQDFMIHTNPQRFEFKEINLTAQPHRISLTIN